jgi:predicted phage tail protein
MYLMGLDDFIATVRSYKVATWLGLQDIEQLTKSYGQEAANVIINTCGTIFSGAVNAKTAETFSKMFGKTNQNKVDANLNKEDISLSYINQMQDLVPASKIITLSQGNFIGKLADTYEQPIELKLFKSYIHVESEAMNKHQKELPICFEGTESELNQAVKSNYQKIKGDVEKIIKLENQAP